MQADFGVTSRQSLASGCRYYEAGSGIRDARANWWRVARFSGEPGGCAALQCSAVHYIALRRTTRKELSWQPH